jgi:ferritin-like metal-binding protein YciE
MKSTSKNTPMERSQLMVLFETELKDIYWAEKALTQALPKMAKNTSSLELHEAITNHLEETEGHILKLEQVFDLIGVKATGKKCEAMHGLILEGEGIVGETEKGPQRDAAIISSAQKVEHYEIASYGTLSTFARTLGLDEASDILADILEEEKNADSTLTELAISGINLEALELEKGMEAEEE